MQDQAQRAGVTGTGNENTMRKVLRNHQEVAHIWAQQTYFPVAHAVRGLALVRSVKARGEEWRTNGHTCHLGSYKVDRITPDGTVYAGCHVVPWQSIERIAPALDAYKDTATI